MANSQSKLIHNDPPMSEELTMQAKLRAAVFDGVSEGDVKEVIQGIVKKAKEGDPKSIKYFFDNILGGAGGTQLTQNNFYNGDPPPPESSINAPPGSPEKVAAMSNRIANGHTAFCDSDGGYGN